MIQKLALMHAGPGTSCLPVPLAAELQLSSCHPLSPAGLPVHCTEKQAPMCLCVLSHGMATVDTVLWLCEQ